MSTPDVTVEFDHHTPEFTEDPESRYRELREKCPVSWTDSYGGFWITTRHADVSRIARDDENFSVARFDPVEAGTAIVIPRGRGLEQYPLELDPPEATRYRELINPLLSKAAVAELVPLIERNVREVMDTFVADGRADLVTQYTNPIPTKIIGEWLGFPEHDWEAIAGPVHDIFSAAPGSARAQRGGEKLGWLEGRIRELFADRRLHPRDDVITYLVTARDSDGQPFTEDGLVSTMFLLIAGGVDTTTSLTGSTLVYLSAHHEDRDRLIRDPDLLDIATEEFLRKFAPSQSMARTVTADVEVGGCPMSRGDRVLIPWAAANHDPAMYPDPDRVLLDRHPRNHLSFGIGSHRCAGAHLARAMFRAMVTEVLTRIPDYRVLSDGLKKNESVGSQAGWDSIPIEFTPAAPRGTAGLAKPASYFETRKVTLTEVRPESEGVVSLHLEAVGGETLPHWEPGAHIDLQLPSGKVRQYSLCGEAGEGTYQVAVLREPDGRGGSAEVHDVLQAGDTLALRGPRNHFRLVDAPRYHFIAGGIGITPVLAMIRDAQRRGAEWTLTYGGRTRTSMAFVDELLALGGDRVTLVPQDDHGHPDLPAILGGLAGDTAVYCCGPEGLLQAVERSNEALDAPLPLYFERFTPPGGEKVDPLPDDAAPFEVELARTGRTVTVPADRTLLSVVLESVPTIAYDCEEGYCGTCETRVLAGEPQHRDTILSDEERAANNSMMICVGRCRSGRLTLDL